MAIVTISQQLGSGGTEVGMAVADRLGYCFVDHKRFQEGAHRYGLETDRLWHLEEERPSLFERFDGETRRYLAVIKSVLYEIAEDDRAVVIGRGGQWLLRDVPHVLRARVVAPAGVRATELLKLLSEQGGERIGAHVAARMVQHDDAQKAKRMRYLFDVELNDPTLYHLVINTGQLDRGAAVELIADLVQRQPQFVLSESGKQMAVDRSLVARVEVVLAGHPITRKYQVEVDARCGVVTLEGPPAALEHAETVIRDLPGVQEIRLRAVEVPPMPPFVG